MTTHDSDQNLSEVAGLLNQVDLSTVQASLQGSNAPVGYDLIAEKNAINYADRQGYEGYALQFADETKGIVELQAIDAWAGEIASMLYTYRSIARSLPTVAGDEAHKRAMYAASFEVLHPAISRVKTLISFKERACAKWTANLALLIRAEAKHKASADAPIPCEALYVQLLSTLDMLAVLDALKDTKAGLNNDFSTYKRAFQHCRADVPDQEAITTENALLQPLLANPQALLTALKQATQRMSGHEAVLADMATLAIEHLENEWYLLPAEKHRLLRAAAHCLWLLDSADKGGANAFHHKRIARPRFAKWLRRYPIVPMYGDMFANLQHVLSRCPNFASLPADELFATSKKEKQLIAEQYDLALRLPKLRTAAAAFSAEFASLIRTVQTLGGGARLMLPRDEHTRTAVALLDATQRGLRLLSELASLVLEALAYKCAHPAPDDVLRSRCRAPEVCEYERALRYNLSDAERASLLELLFLLKGLEASLHRVCGEGEVLLMRAVHEHTQTFVHKTMGGPMRKAVKYEKRALKASLLQLRNMAADWAGDVASLMDEKRIVSKEFKFASHADDYPARACAPSQTQLWLMRATARSLYDERSQYIKSSLMNEADLGKETVREMRAFVSTSAHFPHLLRLSSTLAELGDLSSLWMREFYLELCKRVQFPISMSLPAILIDHVLASGNSPLAPMLITAFDAYSDAAGRALTAHGQQHLYVEIEAEANLLFDQVLYSLSEQIFATFKARAAVALLAEFGLQSAEMPHDAEVAAALGKNWYLPLLHLRHVRILGRSIDVGRLITQRMNTMVRASLDLALAKFEAKSLDAVVELSHSFAVTRLAHSHLAAELPDLDSFEACLHQTTDQVSFLSFHSRVLTHALTECLSDLIPNFAFRSDGGMFQRPLPTSFTQPPEREPPPKAAGAHLGYGSRLLNAEYAMSVARLSGFFGVTHAEALLAVLGDGGLQTLLATLNEHVEELLLYAVHAYVAETQRALPESTKLPSYQYGAQGCYLFFEAKLKDLANYEELHSGVFHSFRRLGNCLALLTLLESAVHSRATTALHQLPPRGQPDPLAKAATAVAHAWGQPTEDSDLVLMGTQATALCQPLASSSSLITHALIAATHALGRLKDEWLAGETPGSDLGAYESSRAFHRVWSAVAFLYATAPYDSARGTVDNATLFGDGVLFAGSYLLHALCQRHRFELLDFSYHVFSVHVADAAGPAEPSLVAFVQRVAMMKRAHDRFAALLEARDAPTVYNVWTRVS